MPPSVMSPLTAVESVFSHVANSPPAWTCFDFDDTAVDEPPQPPVTCAPGVHCGISATAHLPLVSAALPDSTPGAQVALGQAMSVPSSSALFHSGVYIGCLSITPVATRSEEHTSELQSRFGISYA